MPPTWPRACHKRREKLWDAARWAEVIDHFRQDNEFDFVLTSGPAVDEQTHIAAITHRTRQKFIDLSGKTDLLTLAALIGQAQLLVTVDSAPVHFAASTHTPQVILFGPTEWASCTPTSMIDPVWADESVSLAANG